ncbi:hypothetical protein ABZ592_12435 [Streptomyces fimicarius]
MSLVTVAARPVSVSALSAIGWALLLFTVLSIQSAYAGALV